MYTVDDVRNALRTGQKQNAMELLKELVQTNPTADAWFLAAKMTSNQEKAVRYLNRALVLNPRHKDSLALLEKFGVSRKTTGHVFLDEFYDAIREQCDRSPLLRRLSPPLQIVSVIVVTIVLVVAVLFSLSTLFADNTPELAAVAPEPQPIVLINEATVMSRLQSGGIVITDIQHTMSELSDERTNLDTFKFYVTDSTRRSHRITLLVYENSSGLILDRDNLARYEQTYEVVVTSNAVMLYPQGLNDPVMTQFVGIFQSLGR